MRLVLIGDGKDRKALETLAHGCAVEFRGQQDSALVRQTMRRTRAVLLPSESFETFGLTVVESMSQGTPVVVSDLGALPELVRNGETGFLCRPGDAESCAASIRKVLELTADVYDRMARAARARVAAQYTGETNAAALLKIYGGGKRVLLVHNYYGSEAPSGENKVFEAEREMLSERGIVVASYTRHSDEIRGKGVVGLVRGALSTVANPFSARALARKIKAFRPDVVHFHNTFPLISPLAVKAAHAAGCRVVMTLHNYRLVCAAGIPMRHGRVCTKCLDKVRVRDALLCRCYRKCLLATLPLAINIWWYRRRWVKWVDAFIVLSAFQRERMLACGIPAEKMIVKGNFTEVPDTPIVPLSERSDEILYVGRLSREKGVFTLLEAWKKLKAQGVV